MVRQILIFKDQPLCYEKSSVTKIEEQSFRFICVHTSVLEVKVVDRCTPWSLFNNNCLQGCSQVVIKLNSHTISWAGSPRALNSLFGRQESPYDLSGEYNHKWTTKMNYQNESMQHFFTEERTKTSSHCLPWARRACYFCVKTWTLPFPLSVTTISPLGRTATASGPENWPASFPEFPNFVTYFPSKVHTLTQSWL